VVCLLQSAVTSERDAWTLTLDSVGRYYERVLGRKADLQNQTAPPGALLDELIGGIYPEKAKLLGQRTAELHRALASIDDDRAFAPEPFNAMAQRSVYQSMRALLRRTFALLEKALPNLPKSFRDEAKEA
ncbi:MAG TPA: alpha-amylase, partial [Spartobacteria bacterium]|nr:alpha-amylase [Spartobacteria bacterium]